MRGRDAARMGLINMGHDHLDPLSNSLTNSLFTASGLSKYTVLHTCQLRRTGRQGEGAKGDLRW